MQLATIPTPFANGVPHLDAIVSAVAQLTQHATMRTASFANMVRSKLNVRNKNTDISELKALIAAQGLLQNLVGYVQVVGGEATGRIEIVAGGRRLAALGELIAEGMLPTDYTIPYLVVTEEEAVAISLAENSGREDMHPADVFEAMLELSRRGKSVDDIALSFRLDALTVKKRLKLANIAPRLLDLYRNEQASFDQMQALAITDDHTAQEQVWDSLPPHSRYAQNIRRLLTAQQVNVRDDRLARFVGVKAFEQAGGVVTRDLFSNAGDGYITDVALLEKLAMAKLKQEGVKLAREGFDWVEVLPRADHATLAAYASVRCTRGELTVEQQARVLELDEKISQLDESINALHEDADTDACSRLDAERDVLDAERRNINQSRGKVPNADDKALAGAVVTLDDFGNVLIRRDVIKPADKSKMTKVVDENDADAGSRRVKAVHSERLTHELTSQCTAALQAEMMDHSDIALAYLTYTLLKKVSSVYSESTLAKINITAPALAEVAQKSRAAVAFNLRRDQLLSRLPDDTKEGGWFVWLAKQSSAVVMELMAFCVASTLDATQHREGANPQFATLARSLKLDMAKWWKASAADYFNHVSKERMVAVVAQAVSAEAAVPLEQMKKAGAADAAERALADVVWLPEMMRAE